MHRTAPSACLLLVLLIAPAGPIDAKPDPGAWDGKTLTVHEWGTFTSLQGSDGAVLEGLRHEERDLPEFVYDLRDYTGVTGVSPKMETPVVYVYSPTERRLRVKVDFPRGLVTQWYPAAFRVNAMGRMVNGVPTRPDGRVLETLKDGFIEWGRWSDLKVLAPGERPALPAVQSDDPWRFCRQVDANTLRTCNLNLARAQAPAGERPRRVVHEHEKCLFYRGLGDFPLPLEGRVRTVHERVHEVDVDVRLRNRGADGPLTHLFVVWVKDGRSGFHYLPSLAERTHLTATLPVRSIGPSTETLVAALADKLVETGLFRQEALAMARTWQHGYFQEEGLRVLYVLPAAFVDRELSLEVTHVGRRKDDPGPIPVVRTFVGRTELLSPEQEAELESTMASLVRGGEQARQRAEHVLRSWGRFAVPYLNRVRALTKDDAVRRVVERRLAELTLRR